MPRRSGAFCFTPAGHKPHIIRYGQSAPYVSDVSRPAVRLGNDWQIHRGCFVVLKKCHQCGNKFECKPSQYEKRVHCSKECMTEAYKIRMRGKNNPNYKNASGKVCINCGQTFNSYNKSRKYCSAECYNASDDKRENARRANDSIRKPKHPCKKCSTPIMYHHTYCSECNPNRKQVKRCLNCKQPVSAVRDVQFCKDCRQKGLHKKEVYSICSLCGIKVPNKRYRKYCDCCWGQTMRIHRGLPRKKDANQNEIVDALEKAGCSVVDASAIGGGFPDLIIGRHKITYLIEVKNPKTRGKLNKLQEKFFDSWTGQIDIAYTIEDAFRIVGVSIVE